MSRQPETHLPIKDLENIGLFKKGQLLMSDSNASALKRGNLTDLLEINFTDKNQSIEETTSIDARISIVNDGKENKVRLDPIYKDVQNHPLLNLDEHMKLISGEISNVSKLQVAQLPRPDAYDVYDDYLSDKEKFDNRTKTVIEFDAQTKQFLSYDSTKVKVPETINDELLTADKKRKLKDGEIITLADDTQMQLKTADKNGFLANKKALIISVLVDGGLSYLLITGIRDLINKQQGQHIANDEAKIYSKGYLDALKKIELQLETKKVKFPNDKSISAELRLVKEEFKKASNLSPKALNTLVKTDRDNVLTEKPIIETDNESSIVDSKDIVNESPAVKNDKSNDREQSSAQRNR